MAPGGGCLCEAVRYELEGAPARVFACHCRDCRKSGGSAFHLGAVFARPDFKLLKGELTSYATKADSGREIVRHFCSICGSGIYNEPAMIADWIVLKAGTLDDLSTLSPIFELFVRSKPDWLELTSVEESFQEMRPSTG